VQRVAGELDILRDLGEQQDVTVQRPEQLQVATTPTGHVYTSVAPQVGIVRRPIAMELYMAEDFRVAS
jgi:hypothetical protein